MSDVNMGDVRVVNGVTLRRASLWIWGPYWLVDNGGRWSAWRLDVSAYPNMNTIHVGTWFELADAVQGVRNDQQRREGERS